MNNSYITIIKEKRTALSRKRVPLNQNECTADFRIGVPFEQNLQRNHYQSTGIIPETGKKQGTIGILTPREKSTRWWSMRNQPFSVFPSPHPTPLVYQQITSRKDNKEPGTSSLSASQRFSYPAWQQGANNIKQQQAFQTDVFFWLKRKEL